jgi:Family of unknown function (DUF6452)
MIYLYSLTRKMIRKVVWFLFFALVAVSCLDEPDCYNLNNSIIGVSFRKMADNKADTVALIGVSINGTDSLFYENRLATGVDLPLNVLSNQAEISFQLLDGTNVVTNRLLLGYNSKAQFVSQDCGERFIISDLNALDSDFDSVRIVNSSPTKTPSTNLIIYRCPVTNLIRFAFRQWYADDDSVGHPRDAFINGITDDYTTGIFYPNDTASSVVLSLNPLANSTQFNFNFVEGGNTIALRYRFVNRTLFSPCGQQGFTSGLSIGSTDFAFARVVNDSIQDPPVTNIDFFRCPDTNLVKIAFRALPDESAPNVSVPIVKITVDYTTEIFYANATVSGVTLPLNAQADATHFSFELESGTVELELGYDRSQAVYHDVCDQTEMTSLRVISSGFATPPEVLNDQISYPADITNLAITIN